MSFDAFSYEKFRGLVGRVFHVDSHGAQVALELTDVTALPPPRQFGESGEPVPAENAEARPDPFTILFVGPPQPILRQQIYRMTADEQNVMEIFIVPIQRVERGIVYQAVFG